MRILYGVQGTGNGHITRANAMASAMRHHPELQVSWLCSGRPRAALNLLEVDFDWRRGLTFTTRAGRVRPLDTLVDNNMLEFVRDIRGLQLSHYDLLITDYEPTIAWAARLQQRPCVGIGHQYAFAHPVPQPTGSRLQKLIMKAFSPVTLGLGLHWHSFGLPVLRPIIDLPAEKSSQRDPRKIVVYLPFENPRQVAELLCSIEGVQFFIYGPNLFDQELGKLQIRSLSRQGFRNDLLTAGGVICNTGFELISECLVLGIKVLTRPLEGQIEQLANANALRALNYATVTRRWCKSGIESWIHHGDEVLITYPKVQQRIAQWIAEGRPETIGVLSDELWQQVSVERRSRSY